MPFTSPIATSHSAARLPDVVPLIRASDLARTVEKGPVIVELMSFSCTSCRAAMVEVERVASELSGRVRFAKVSASDAAGQHLMSELGATRLPTFAVFHDGELLGTIDHAGPTPLTADFLRDNVEVAFDSIGLRI